MSDPEEPSKPKPYDPATWQPEDGDPFAGNGYDRASQALNDNVRDESTQKLYVRRVSSPGEFLFGWLMRYFFPIEERRARDDRPAAQAAPESAAPAESGPETETVEDELKPGEEFNFRRFSGGVCVSAGLVLAARGAIGVYGDADGALNRLAGRLPFIGDIDRDRAFVALIVGLLCVFWGAGRFMITDRESDEMDRRAGPFWRRR